MGSKTYKGLGTNIAYDHDHIFTRKNTGLMSRLAMVSHICRLFSVSHQLQAKANSQTTFLSTFGNCTKLICSFLPLFTADFKR